MKARELRIGNRIERSFEDSPIGSEEVTVRTIWDIVQIEGGTITKFSFNPIPLTEGWLLQFGFKQTIDLKGWINDDSLLAIYDFGDGFGLDTHDGIIGKKFEFVHQLQNLYFAITGEELIFINPPKL